MLLIILLLAPEPTPKTTHSSVRNLIYILTLFGALSSCIKENVSKCPAQYSILLEVVDKNYLNAALSPVSQPLSEDLPFRQYVRNLSYTLYNTKTHQAVNVTPVFTVTNDAKEQELFFDSIPNGNYLLIVWGNLPDSTPSVDSIASLHPTQSESTDLYLASKYLEFTSKPQSATLGLERSKGKLQIICKDFPDSVARVEIDISSLLGRVGRGFNYDSIASVTKSFTLSGAAPVLETYLSPTAGSGMSNVNLTLFKADNTPVFTTTPIEAKIKRNELYIVEANYNIVNHAWTIWLFIDGTWVKVYELSLVSGP